MKKILVGMIVLAQAAGIALAGEVNLDLKEAEWEIKPGLVTEAWTYNGTVPGQPIFAELGEKMIITGVNNLPVTTTNIHWHGLMVPNNEDGPSRLFSPGDKFSYEFNVKETGSYWYHSHFRPVVEQVDMGLYAPFIVKAPEDSSYSGDHVLMFDDWYLGRDGKRLEGTGVGHMNMERQGNLETINGKSAEGIPALEFTKGELHKFRFMNASTAVEHTISVQNHKMRITHTDGRQLEKPMISESVTIYPGERVDVEVLADGEVGQTYYLVTNRPEFGIKMPIRYTNEIVEQVKSPLPTSSLKGFAGIDEKQVDFELFLNSRMKQSTSSNSSNNDSMMGMSGHSMMNNMSNQDNNNQMTEWTINDNIFPNVPPMNVKVGEVVKVRIHNNDNNGMHAMNHPMHLHGGYFQVVSRNGVRPGQNIFKDTINIPPGEYVDIAFSLKEVGDWMLHCHILDHEDGGMMMVVRASK